MSRVPFLLFSNQLCLTLHVPFFYMRVYVYLTLVCSVSIWLNLSVPPLHLSLCFCLAGDNLRRENKTLVKSVKRAKKMCKTYHGMCLIYVPKIQKRQKKMANFMPTMYQTACTMCLHLIRDIIP